MIKTCRIIVDLTAFLGKAVSWLILPLIVFVVTAVVAGQVGVNRIAGWEGDVPFLGSAVTVNTLTDLQWTIFALLVLFGGVYALRDDAHVNVDFLSAAFPPRVRQVVEVIGDLIFLLPLCIIITWFGVKFALTSWTSGEASTYGGLTDRWFLKACIPLAFGLLAIAGLARAVGTLAALISGRDADEDQ
ncbi:TRAP transporter small permease subunit [Acuticoccus mangrovi]|uniref:TRAP transporter small permease protein n=1 Tax=Acuticoccus mangrovi TaxID=2796142 RepID=A0A934ILK3_9HYPH|nr:TRAP transporter small permease subunit [Acuticoccus mangrovi]MBJ3774165.1 TRAP transporter small permease subunit [Acuticoccus mangrovi]